jgi:hypothetical protein
MLARPAPQPVPPDISTWGKRGEKFLRLWCNIKAEFKRFQFVNVCELMFAMFR